MFKLYRKTSRVSIKTDRGFREEFDQKRPKKLIKNKKNSRDWEISKDYAIMWQQYKFSPYLPF